MKWHFKKSAKQEKGAANGKWQAKVEHGKRKLAGWLQRQSDKLSIRTKKILLIVCCTVFGSLMLWQVFNGLGGHRLPDIGKVIKPLTPLPLERPGLDSGRSDSTGLGNKRFNHQKRKQ